MNFYKLNFRYVLFSLCLYDELTKSNNSSALFSFSGAFTSFFTQEYNLNQNQNQIFRTL